MQRDIWRLGKEASKSCMVCNLLLYFTLRVSKYQISILLTLNVRGPSYFGLTRSISWLLMSLGHQQSWYWLYSIYGGPYLIWGTVLSTCVILMWRDGIKCKDMFMYTLKDLTRKALIKIICDSKNNFLAVNCYLYAKFYSILAEYIYIYLP